MRWKPFISPILLLVALLGCRGPVETNVPSELHGRWTTDAPGWEDRFIQLDLDRFEIGTGERYPSLHHIEEVLIEPKDTFILYTLLYETDGGEYRLSLEHDTSADVLRVVNRPSVIWTRETSSGTRGSRV